MNETITGSFKLGLLAFGVTLLVACQQKDAGLISDRNVVDNSDQHVAKTIGDEKASYLVLGKAALAQRLATGEVLQTSDADAAKLLGDLAELSVPGTATTATPGDNSLTVGYPVGLLKENQVFGGVITKVSNKDSEDLGMLKLSDLTPVHVRTAVAKTSDGNYALALLGCAKGCTEASAQVPLVAIPIVGVDANKQLVLLDLSSLGGELNLMEFMDPDGSYTKLQTKSSKTTALDYSVSTLVFDVETTMVPKATTAANPTETVFSARWYLKLDSGFNPAFTPRPATEGVGFFMTERTANPKIQRYAEPVSGLAGDVKYYLKNIPPAFRKSFATAFDTWNTKFVAMTGQKIFSYEFVEQDDPRYKLLVPGDVRYNIIEWDLDNKAPYGGLGPSMANQFTGQIFSANVLIQGPTIVDLYSKWFKVSQDVQELRDGGLDAEADELLRITKQQLEKELGTENRPKFAISLGEQLPLRVGSQTPALADPLFQRDDFDVIPAGFTFETYMDGYFQDMVGHELGHNLGLRHNFRGNLGATASVQLGGVSRSIMEYLGREYRAYDRVGEYDVMALKYGYLGEVPGYKNQYCTDEDKPDAKNLGKSAECSSDDATADPFGFFESRLARAVNRLIERGQSVAPTWTVADMDRELVIAVTGMTLYAATADATASRWTNFFNGGDRPSSPSGVRSYVLGKLKTQLCDPTLAQVAAGKSDEAGKTKVLENVAALRAKVATVVAPYNVFSNAELQCN